MPRLKLLGQEYTWYFDENFNKVVFKTLPKTKELNPIVEFQKVLTASLGALIKAYSIKSGKRIAGKYSIAAFLNAHFRHALVKLYREGKLQEWKQIGITDAAVREFRERVLETLSKVAVLWRHLTPLVNDQSPEGIAKWRVLLEVCLPAASFSPDSITGKIFESKEEKWKIVSDESKKLVEYYDTINFDVLSKPAGTTPMAAPAPVPTVASTHTPIEELVKKKEKRDEIVPIRL